MKLLPDLNTSWMGKPDPVRLALDSLGGFSHCNVLESYQSGKAKRFTIEYVGFNECNLRVSYEEKGGQTKAIYWGVVEKNNA